MPDNKLWRCVECLSTFPKSKLLETHARHTKHKAYRCSKGTACQSSFSLRTALIRHESSHATHKKHVCRYCDKAFHRRDHCQEHEGICSTLLQGNGSSAMNPGMNDQATEATAASLLTRMRSREARSQSTQGDQDTSQIEGSNVIASEERRSLTLLASSSTTPTHSAWETPHIHNSYALPAIAPASANKRTEPSPSASLPGPTLIESAAPAAMRQGFTDGNADGFYRTKLACDLERFNTLHELEQHEREHHRPPLARRNQWSNNERDYILELAEPERSGKSWRGQKHDGTAGLNVSALLIGMMLGRV